MIGLDCVYKTELQDFDKIMKVKYVLECRVFQHSGCSLLISIFTLKTIGHYKV